VTPVPVVLDETVTPRRLLLGTRALLGAFAVLTVLAFVSLFVLAENTRNSFAWTIEPPLTAAFLGAGYAAGSVLVLLSLRQSVWANVRVSFLTIFVFVVLTLVATLLHVNKMHFDDDFGALGLLAKGAAWFWSAVYVVLPVAMLVLLVRQERAPGVDPPARHPVPGVLRVALAVESAALVVVGALLFVDPASATSVWPWPLTPFTARVTGAWLIAFGLAAALAALAGDLHRLRSATIAYTVFGALVLVSVLRYPGTVAWNRPVAWAFVVLAAAVVVTGASGWRLAPTAAGPSGV
jgi:hypothetical protein